MTYRPGSPSYIDCLTSEFKEKSYGWARCESFKRERCRKIFTKMEAFYCRMAVSIMGQINKI